MELALNLGYWHSGDIRSSVDVAVEAETLGYSSVWAAEAYGSDVPTVLSWIAARTARVDVGAAVMQIPARSPAATAMTAATLDALSDGRFRLGLGVSGPQVSEGWHGAPFARPLTRTREYVDIVRQVLSRQRLQYEGEQWQLPLPGGPGKALRLAMRPLREQIPIYLAAIGPRNLELAGEIADGWLAVFYSPEYAPEALERIATGRRRVGGSMDGFDVVPSVPLVIGDDVEACADVIRPYAALYLGGMGSREQNFYNQLAVRMGFDDAAARVQELFLDGQQRAAAAAVPSEFIDQTALIGPVERVRDRLHAYAESGVSTLSVIPQGSSVEEQRQTLRSMADAFEAAGVAS
ncbi:LLM class F420-dependent oxidoreductase [Actinobacteria bacterium YIM 96077]|uniref:LLM class F420-dependent oxidoreductase n=1 Tax=Phytoactinopolyspora halophila TaxID=1981511 RepID=A0A329QFY6_9ACTN|nr:LLM class F420-dependent oxidoreductase [Phytoactinopolyspora halophila]AYY13478.1 LLM class F420-dependent oxidoreductase [Actinobacteria bacterium YIM 96077]RAW10871.1 LLM class F420-dependent oxidoreductase [Phytoactinopolyspora halophila]